MKIEQRDPKDIYKNPHAVLNDIPELPQDSVEFLAIADSVHRGGILQPLLVDEHDRVLDDESRTLAQCAWRWKLASVPVLVCSSEDAALICLTKLASRRHLTKSALAYLCCPLLEPAFAAARAKRLENLENTQCFSKVSSGDYRCKTVEDLASELGIKRNLLFEARKVHQEFEDKKVYWFNVDGGAADGAVVECTLKDWFEPKILRAPIGGEHEQNRPLGLGGVIAGIASVIEERRGVFNPGTRNQLELFGTGIGQFTSRALKITPEKMRQSIREWMQAHEDKFTDEQLDQLEQLGESIKVEVRTIKKSKTA